MKAVDVAAIIGLSALGDAWLLATGHAGIELLAIPLLGVALPFAGFFAWVNLDLKLNISRRARIAQYRVIVLLR